MCSSPVVPSGSGRDATARTEATTGPPTPPARTLPQRHTSLARAVAQPPGKARLQRPQLDEARGSRLREEASRRREGGEARVIDGVGRGARDHAGAALVELYADLARDALVDVLHVCIQVRAQWLPPRPRVDEVGPLT